MKRLPRPKTDAGTWGDDDTGCGILHVDMDAFFAMVELRERPELVGRPVIIGGGDRGVVLSATYEARAYGVNSAMPMARARKLCPHAVVIPPSHGVYHDISSSVMAFLRSLTPAVEPVSVDEAFLDVSGARRLIGTPSEIAVHIRHIVERDHGITCSVGVAPTKFVAKLASTAAKPNGMLLISADNVTPFLRSLPIGAMWGVGAKTEEHLGTWGITTIAHLADADPAMLERAVGTAAGQHLYALAHGIDPRPVTTSRVEKSIGAERTYMQDTADAAVVKATILDLSDRCAGRLRRAGLRGRTVAIKLRRADFSTFTRSRTLASPTDTAEEIFSAAVDLMDHAPIVGDLIRLVGVRVENLTADEALQLVLDVDGHGDPQIRRDAEVAVDSVRERFGRQAVSRATLISSPSGFQLRDGGSKLS